MVRKKTVGGAIKNLPSHRRESPLKFSLELHEKSPIMQHPPKAKTLFSTEQRLLPMCAKTLGMIMIEQRGVGPDWRWPGQTGPKSFDDLASKRKLGSCMRSSSSKAAQFIRRQQQQQTRLFLPLKKFSTIFIFFCFILKSKVEVVRKHTFVFSL